MSADSADDGPTRPVGERERRGRAARSPLTFPRRGWKDVAVRVWAEAKEDRLVLLSAGVAFFALIALVPALIAVVSLFGLLADPAEVSEQVQQTLAAAPDEVQELVGAQLEGITESSSTGLGVGLIAGVAVALWSASSGMKSLIEAINAVYDETETRSFLPLRGLALGLTLAAIVFVVIAFLTVAVVPALLGDSSLGEIGRWTVSILRWPALAVAWILGLAVLYRLAPDREDPQWRWVTPGAVVATVVWLAGSVAFSVYTSRFASYNETYGALGAVVITMLWLLVTAVAILLGAEVNAEVEHQTAVDSTTGEPRALGTRGAEMADTVGATHR